jgi:hypothetical protein
MVASGAGTAAECVASAGFGCAGAAVGGSVLDWYVYSHGYFKGSYLRDEDGM